VGVPHFFSFSQVFSSRGLSLDEGGNFSYFHGIVDFIASLSGVRSLCLKDMLK